MSTLQQIALFPDIHQPGEVVLPPDTSNSVAPRRANPDQRAVTKQATVPANTTPKPSTQQAAAENKPSAQGKGRKKPETVTIPRGYLGPDDQIIQMLSDVQVASLLGIGRATVWRWLKDDPDFPKPIKFRDTTTRWFLNDIIEYINRFVPGAPK
jgi:prophage regulatory protein